MSEDKQWRIDPRTGKPVHISFEEAAKISEGITSNPLDKRIGPEQARDLLLESISPIHTGATVITGQTAEKDITRQLAGYVEIDEQTEYGQRIVESYQSDFEDPRTFDNETRWTLIDHGREASVVVEIQDVDVENSKILNRAVIAFEYPKDREFLLVAGYTGWIMVHAGDIPIPKDHKGLYHVPPSRNSNSQVLEISTGDQVTEMVIRMDELNPTLRKRSLKEIMSDLDIAQEAIPDVILAPWGNQGQEGLIKALKQSERPLSTTMGIFLTLAIVNALEADLPKTSQQIAEIIDASAETVEQVLIGVFQSDTPWCWGREVNGEWQWIRDESITNAEIVRYYDGVDIMKANDRLKISKRLLNSIDINIPVEEISPALALATRIIDTTHMKKVIFDVLNKKTPVWSGAKGFAKTYEQVKETTRIQKNIGVKEGSSPNGLTSMHIALAHHMQSAHVVTMTAAQFRALPDLEESEAIPFIQHTPPPFDPLFIDIASGDELFEFTDLTFSSDVGKATILGALIRTTTDGYATTIMPIFYYPLKGVYTATALGAIAINRTDNPTQKFDFQLGSHERFDRSNSVKILVAGTNTLNELEKKGDTRIIDAYSDAIFRAAKRFISALYMIEAANVELHPVELQRRDKKRQEKRGWLIPLTVRVKRPAPRQGVQNGHHGTTQDVEWSHQWEVMGHVRHVKRGPMVACIVCGGNETRDLECPRCHGTGLDPEKTKPCFRIDVKTGNKTCPDGCRIVMVPPYVKGPLDTPLIIKSRKITS